tara:strand:+ start:894 stop:1664 length:771 start_codon:yes stop_codon:yes gene_type:complete
MSDTSLITENETREYWKAEEEKIIKQWADKALCYHWMHSRCREIYQKKNTWFTIPVIIISTVTGTTNFAQDRFSDDIKEYVVMGIGSLSIIAGIITTISQFLQISELNEGYRAAAISWNKLHTDLKTLVSRHPLDRMPPNQAIKLYKDEYEHLFEVSPPITKKVQQMFNSRFKKNINLIKPEICNKLDPTDIFEITDLEREYMIDKLNNVKTNPRITETFFNINGRDASDAEIASIELDLNNETHNEVVSTRFTVL